MGFIASVKRHLHLLLVNRSSVLVLDINGVEPANLLGELLRMLGSDRATDHGILAVEVLGDFLEGSVASFDEEEL